MTDFITWLGIVFCLSQSAAFSGLNLAYFNMSRLRLEIMVANGDLAAARILELRRDANFLLTTILWGNVGINVLLTLLSNSVMTGVAAFLFSTFVITLGGEIAPQAYFSRNALRMAALLSPLIRFYQALLYPIAKPSALLLDLWLGGEGLQFFRERELRHLIHKHIDAAESEVDVVEGIGALNFLALDDVPVTDEGEEIIPETIFELPVARGRPEFFAANRPPAEVQRALAMRVAATGRQWMIVVDQRYVPVLALDGNAYLRSVFVAGDAIVNPFDFCHRPVVVTDPRVRLGAVISRFKADSSAQSDHPLKHDVILLWGAQKRIITGSDILGRLFKGIGLYSSIGGPVRDGCG
jgi:metal transporter CNNM